VVLDSHPPNPHMNDLEMVNFKKGVVVCFVRNFQDTDFSTILEPVKVIPAALFFSVRVNEFPSGNEVYRNDHRIQSPQNWRDKYRAKKSLPFSEGI
jgi:hypothetical protein